MELGPENHDKDGLAGPHSIMVAYADPLGKLCGPWVKRCIPKVSNNPLRL